MAKKKNVTVGDLGPWDKFKTADVATALTNIYSHATAHSAATREWYWRSIKSKRIASISGRSLSYALLVSGALLPVIAVLLPDEFRLPATQIGVVAIALAGLLLGADRIFGWSSGWLRYVTTVTQMESMTLQFELDWARYILSKQVSLNDGDRKALFDLASSFEQKLTKAQSDETDKWVVEFTNSVAALSDLIKAQRESAEKAVNAAQLALQAKRAEEAAREKSGAPGAIEMTIAHKGAPVPVSVAVDQEAPTPYLGTVWAKTGVAPGHHTLTIAAAGGSGPVATVIADVPAGGIARITVTPP